MPASVVYSSRLGRVGQLYSVSYLILKLFHVNDGLSVASPTNLFVQAERAERRGYSNINNFFYYVFYNYRVYYATIQNSLL